MRFEKGSVSDTSKIGMCFIMRKASMPAMCTKGPSRPILSPVPAASTKQDTC